MAVFYASLHPALLQISIASVNATVPLKDNGIYTLETMNTGPLVRDGVKEFMFVLGQPLIKGTVQAMIKPVALY